MDGATMNSAGKGSASMTSARRQQDQRWQEERCSCAIAVPCHRPGAASIRLLTWVAQYAERR